MSNALYSFADSAVFQNDVIVECSHSSVVNGERGMFADRLHYSSFTPFLKYHIKQNPAIYTRTCFTQQ